MKVFDMNDSILCEVFDQILMPLCDYLHVVGAHIFSQNVGKPFFVHVNSNDLFSLWVYCLNVHRIDLITLVNKVLNSLGFDLSLTLASLVDSLFACFASFISTLSTHADVNLKLVYYTI